MFGDVSSVVVVGGGGGSLDGIPNGISPTAKRSLHCTAKRL